ncbi:hypothetical protein SLE2022_350860 [Rubroshorea leprosula]
MRSWMRFKRSCKQPIQPLMDLNKWRLHVSNLYAMPPKNIEHILRTRFDNYPKGPRWQEAFHDLLGEGIFNSDGETWLIQRKTVALEFTTRTLRQAMSRWVNRTIKKRLWCILDKAAEENRAVDLQDLLLRLTFDNICGLTFGKDPETLSPELPVNWFAIAFDTATKATLYRFLYPGFQWRLQKLLEIGTEKKLKQSLEIVDNYMNDAVAARKENPSDDLLSRFMKKKEMLTVICFQPLFSNGLL